MTINEEELTEGELNEIEELVALVADSRRAINSRHVASLDKVERVRKNEAMRLLNAKRIKLLAEQVCRPGDDVWARIKELALLGKAARTCNPGVKTKLQGSKQ